MKFPKIIKKTQPFLLKKCTVCGGDFGPDSYIKTKSLFYPDGFIPICNNCVAHYLRENDFSWNIIDKLCQLADVPFIPKELERIHSEQGDDFFPLYASLFFTEEYDDIDWTHYYTHYKELTESELIDELPRLREEQILQLQQKWGANYDAEALHYLEGLYNGLLSTQNVNGALQADQALKICKISYEVDQRIRAGADFDKTLAAYDKLVKIAEFTPRNVKNLNDFDSVGELFRWLEKRGWRNQYYDNVPKDVVDETIQNIQASNQRLYTNESGIGDEIKQRIEQLKSAAALEHSSSTYGTDEIEFNQEEYENKGFVDLFADEHDNDEFITDIGERDG